MNKDRRFIRKRLSGDRKGDILGMPLYLFIIIIVTVIGLGILLTWLSMIDDPPTNLEVRASPNFLYIYDDGTHGDSTPGDDMYTNDPFTITIFVKDNNGDEIAGALVSLEGAGVKTAGGERVTGETDDNGQVVFPNLKITDQWDDGKITVEANKEDLTATNSIPVQRK